MCSPIEGVPSIFVRNGSQAGCDAKSVSTFQTASGGASMTISVRMLVGMAASLSKDVRQYVYAD
jgi:hypothetical protein